LAPSKKFAIFRNSPTGVQDAVRHRILALAQMELFRKIFVEAHAILSQDRDNALLVIECANDSSMFYVLDGTARVSVAKERGYK